MSRKTIIYHGSKDIIEKPEYGKGNPHNDYGRGFYCTEFLELAKEWACDDSHGGYANKYKIDMTDLKVQNLNGDGYCILHWVSLLLQNRNISLDSELAMKGKEYIIRNFPIDLAGYDIVKGYRADDSYFSYTRDFLQNTISVRRLSQVMKLGNLGEQIVLISPKAFSQIEFLGYETAEQHIHYPLRKKRDDKARQEYFLNKSGNILSEDEVYLIDIIRRGLTADDPQLQ